MEKPNPEMDELRRVIANQHALGRRMLWLLVVPLVMTVFMAVMFFILNARLKDVEIATKIVTIERFFERDNSNYEWAISQYERLKDTNPNAEILTRLGELYFLRDPKNNENEKMAINVLDKARGYDPKNWGVYRTLTFIHTSKRRTKDAIQVGEMALKLNDHDANTLNNLGWVYATCEPEFQNLSRALDYSTQAVTLTQRRNPEFLDTLAQVYKARGQDDLARAALREAISIAPNDQQPKLKYKFKELFPKDALTEAKEASQ